MRYNLLFGNPYLNDTFCNMAVWSGNLYLLLTTRDEPESISARKFNLVLYEIRGDTGFINQRVRMGSQGVQDEAIDIQITYRGIYLLAKVGSQFCIEG